MNAQQSDQEYTRLGTLRRSWGRESLKRSFMITVSLKEIVQHLDSHLEPEPIDDVAVNGLQVPGSDSVHRIAVSPDATFEVFEEVVRRDCNFLFVHHGIFWTYNREDRITELKKKRLKLLFDYGISLYASHCPLDIHPQHGNNQTLFNLLELQDQKPMGQYNGRNLGLMGTAPDGEIDLGLLVQKLEAGLQDQVRVYGFHPDPVRKIAIITGQGQFGLKEAHSAGFDTFITGEMNHYMYHDAKENGTNVILAGHYRSETLGPKAIGQHLHETFGLPYEFLDFPTGL